MLRLWLNYRMREAAKPCKRRASGGGRPRAGLPQDDRIPATSEEEEHQRAGIDVTLSTIFHLS